MGHVDHGKTTLLDAIRKSNAVSKEHGGITQHIGASQVNFKGRTITFIDTPGHAAFAKMRSQGAQVTDMVVLVVAANDGVKPQTKEALSHIRSAKVPFLVALNKIDLPDIDKERIKGQLAKEDVIVKDYGGDIVCVETSATKKQNLDQLLEMILLVANLQDLSADPEAELEAVIIEAHTDKRKGVLASLLIKNGTLRIGSEFEINNQKVKVRALIDSNGNPISKAGPSTPVSVLGFKTMPKIGDFVGSKQKIKTSLPEAVLLTPKKSLTEKEAKDEPEPEDNEDEQEKQTINIILKADVLGTLEAITSNLSDEVKIVAQGVGEVNESDVLLAQASKSTIYAFNVGILRPAEKLAELEKIKVITYNIIYKLFEDLEKQVLKMLEPTIDEEVLGEAKIVAEFKIKDTRIAGCKIVSGEINKALPIHLKRGKEIIKDTKIKSLKRGKEDIDKIKKGGECGISFKPQIDFKINDAIISYRKIDDL